MIGRETLVAKAVKAPRRFRPRIGSGALTAPTPSFRTRTVVSEYAYSTFRDSPDALHELRSVISVDGKPVSQPEEARVTLTSGVRSADDNLKKKLLRDFERYGLSGEAVVDFGQLILLFEKRQLPNYDFTFAGYSQLGSEPVTILSFIQKEGPASLTIFEKNQAIRQRLQGEVWVRKSDLLPLRIRLDAVRTGKSEATRDETTVDYELSRFGLLLPAKVLHQKLENEILVSEHAFTYEGFQKFSADAEVKFDVSPDSSNPPPPKP